jgi:hypothetical protein
VLAIGWDSRITNVAWQGTVPPGGKAMPGKAMERAGIEPVTSGLQIQSNGCPDE